MYLHLGEDVVIKTEDIIGIFDLEKSSVSKHTKSFFSHSTKQNEVINVSYEMPKSFILTKENGENKVYISQISPATLCKRAKMKSKF